MKRDAGGMNDGRWKRILPLDFSSPRSGISKTKGASTAVSAKRVQMRMLSWQKQRTTLAPIATRVSPSEIHY